MDNTGQNDASGNSSFENKNIIDLLGLQDISESEKIKIIEALSRKTVQRAIEEVLNDSSISEEQKEKMDLIIAENISPNEIQLKLIQLFPFLLKRITDNAQQIKMEMCLKQMETMLSNLRDKISDEDYKSLSTFYNDAKSFSEKFDTSNFFMIWLKYSSLINNG